MVTCIIYFSKYLGYLDVNLTYIIINALPKLMTTVCACVVKTLFRLLRLFTSSQVSWDQCTCKYWVPKTEKKWDAGISFQAYCLKRRDCKKNLFSCVLPECRIPALRKRPEGDCVFAVPDAQTEIMKSFPVFSITPAERGGKWDTHFRDIQML